VGTLPVPGVEAIGDGEKVGQLVGEEVIFVAF
jgi:hypothetical protein